MSNEALFDFAISHNHEIVFRNLKETKAITVEYDHFYIALANGLPRTEEKEIAAHELGHCEYGGTYCRASDACVKARAEYRANKWAYYQLVPPDEILACVDRGMITSWELAEYFNVSNAFIHKAINLYRATGVI